MTSETPQGVETSIEAVAQNVPTATLEAATEAAQTPRSNSADLATAKAAIDEKQKLEEVAMYGFQMGFPKFQEQLEKISSRSLRRAWLAAVAGPLMEKEPHFSYPEEKEAYAMAIKLDEYKFSMILLGIDKYMLHGKDKVSTKENSSAPVSSLSDNDGTPSAGTDSASGSSAAPTEENLHSDEQPGTSSENAGTV